MMIPNIPIYFLFSDGHPIRGQGITGVPLNTVIVRSRVPGQQQILGNYHHLIGPPMSRPPHNYPSSGSSSSSSSTPQQVYPPYSPRSIISPQASEHTMPNGGRGGVPAPFLPPTATAAVVQQDMLCSPPSSSSSRSELEEAGSSGGTEEGTTATGSRPQRDRGGGEASKKVSKR